MEHSKTPQFDALLDGILSSLVPHTRICTQSGISKYCEGEFSITNEDIEFLKMLRVPAPLCCPTCRKQKRFAFVNRSSFYKRKNDAPNGQNPMISYVPPNSPLTVYDYDYYRSGKWEPFSYGREFDHSRSFFGQLYDLRRAVPQPGLMKDPSNINYEYSLNGRDSKNVYCSSGIFRSEDIWYTVFANKCRSIMDANNPTHSENCSNAFYIDRSNNCHWIYYSNNCIDCRFVYDCRNCQDCFGCVNLRNKRYHFFNQQLSKEEYEVRVKELEIDKRSSVAYIQEKFWEFVKSNPVLASRSSQALDSSGVLLTNCKNCTECVSVSKSEYERYADSVVSHRDSMDIYASGGSELMYQTSGAGSECANVRFLVGSKFITHSEYLINCHNCQFCFGCVGIEKKNYCIFNVQYDPQEYFKKLDEIKHHLLKKGEYGEFFPYEFSAYAYNGSDVDGIYPLSEGDIKKLGALYQEDIETDLAGISTVSVDELPDSINDVTDDVLSKAIICEETGKPFRIIASELEFYRRNAIPVPIVHPYRRTKNFFRYMGNHHTYDGSCESCGAPLQTIYEPSLGWRLHCEVCFQREVV